MTYSDAIGLGGSITADILNQEYQVELLIDEDNYTIVARAVDSVTSITVDGVYTPVPVVANASDTGEGGGSTIGAYQINIGVDTSISEIRLRINLMWGHMWGCILVFNIIH